MTTQRVIAGDCVDTLRSLPAGSVHCCVTSPPYWGLRDYGHAGQLGRERSPGEYVASMVRVFGEVRRVLRDDGTLWLNLGDTYAPGRAVDALKPKDLAGVPWRVAFALQADGWFLRQDIIWHKPNPMPHSVRDRCTTAHEYLFLLTKRPRYFFDAVAINETAATAGQRGLGFYPKRAAAMGRKPSGNEAKNPADGVRPQTRNRRSVWTVTTKPYRGAHFATMPPDLVAPCLAAGCPERCCGTCGAPIVRIVSRERVPTRPGRDTKTTGDRQTDGNRDPLRHVTTTTTLGWRPSCDCGPADVVAGTALDPFAGSGTTLAVAATLGRNAIGCELNPEYVALADARIAESRSRFALLNQ
jgi:DNA modification methylase